MAGMTPNNGPRLAHGASGQHAPRGRSSRPRLIALLLTAVFATGLAATAVAATPALPACKIGDVYTKHRGYSDWSRSLLDTTFRLWSGYAPSDLRNTSLAGLNSGYYVRSFVVADLKAMAAAAKAAGARLSVQSGYRSYTAQITAFNNEIRIYGYATALTTSARPGHSEHQLGTTLDFKSYGGSAAWNYSDWGTSAAGKWLKANAWKYGFVMPYPKGKSSVTCYAYEPWHSAMSVGRRPPTSWPAA